MKKHSLFYSFAFMLVYPFIHLLYPHRVTGRELIPDGAAIVCAPHSSYLDPVLVSLAVGKKHRPYYMAKKELFSVPLLGAFLKYIGIFPVDRSGGDVESIRKSMRLLKSGCKVGIFPEGQRVADDDAVAAKTGAVRLAEKMKAPIVPVYVPRVKKPLRRFKIVIGEPITVERTAADDYAAEAERVMHIIYELGETEK